MVPLEGSNVTVFRHLAVFAPTPRSISHKLSARFGHELLAILGRRLERQACFGLDQIQQAPNSHITLQGFAFRRIDRSALIALRELRDAFGRPAGKLPPQNRLRNVR